jgi:hypothetical protein
MAPATTTAQPNLGAGVKPPQDFNNAGFMFLFAILGAAMVALSIYFFFVARNGGFYWKKGDWDDYKSTVLRRKGPNGTTLSNATKSTKLGGGSVVPKWAKSEYTQSTESTYDPKEMREMENGNAHGVRREQHRQSSRRDPELQAYKHEKAAKVGGINTSHHGSQWDYTNTDRSEVTSPPISKKDKQAAAKEEKERKRREKAELKQQAKDEAARAKEDKKARKDKNKGEAAPSVATEDTEPARPDRAQRSYPSNAYSFHQGDDATSVYTATNTVTTDAPTQSSIRQVSYYESYHPSSQVPPIREQPTPTSSDYRRSTTTPHRSSRDSLGQVRQSPSHSRQGSPRKQHRSSRPPASDHTVSTADTGTKVYSHHIPGLSNREVGFDDSVSQVGARQSRAQQQAPHASQQTGGPSSAGYRRGGRGRRDSLSDSEM